MYHNYRVATATEALPILLNDLLGKGEEVGSRAGRTVELTHVGITLTDPRRREILTPGRKPSIAAQIAETMWVLTGRNDVGWLSHYLPRAGDFSDDGQTWRAGYGPRLRSWSKHVPANGMTYDVDQWARCVRLLREDPSTRRAVMSIWDPAKDYDESKDIPCNNWLSWSSRLGFLDLHVAIRSNDAMWGWSGINAFEWSAMLEITAGLLGLRVGSLHFSTTSFHLYQKHWEKARKIVKMSEEPVRPASSLGSPRFDADVCGRSLERFDAFAERWFEVEKALRSGEEAHSEIEHFEEPMLQSWLRVLGWWWSGNPEYLAALEGTELERACKMSVQPPEREPQTHWSVLAEEQTEQEEQASDFLEFAIDTHNEKHDAYGDSWKKRGEVFSILPNIGRKVDRLGGKQTSDETSADTAMDLMVYLAKYRVWLDDQSTGSSHSDLPNHPNALLRQVEGKMFVTRFPYTKDLETDLKEQYESLLLLVEKNANRKQAVDSMLRDAYVLAKILWDDAQKTKRDRAEQRDAALMGIEYRGADVD